MKTFNYIVFSNGITISSGTVVGDVVIFDTGAGTIKIAYYNGDIVFLAPAANVVITHVIEETTTTSTTPAL